MLRYENDGFSVLHAYYYVRTLMIDTLRRYILSGYTTFRFDILKMSCACTFGHSPLHYLNAVTVNKLGADDFRAEPSTRGAVDLSIPDKNLRSVEPRQVPIPQ